MALIADTRQPVIARATALSELPGVVDRPGLRLLQQMLDADNPLLRLGALGALDNAPPEQTILALPLVRDEQRVIRINAARLAAQYARQPLPPEDSAALGRAIEEYQQTQLFNAERPEAQTNLGGLYESLDRPTEAEAAYRLAIELQPQFLPAYVNLAQLLAAQERNREAIALLKAGLAEVPDAALLHHARGLALVRDG